MKWRIDYSSDSKNQIGNRLFADPSNNIYFSIFNKYSCILAAIPGIVWGGSLRGSMKQVGLISIIHCPIQSRSRGIPQIKSIT